MQTLLPHFNNDIKTIQKTHKLHPFYVDEMEEYIDNIDKLINLDVTIGTGKPHSLQGTKGTADGEKFDSIWEYVFYLYQKECNNSIVIRNHTDNFPYTDENGKMRKFYPDFVVNGVYYEVKGWLRPSDQCKMDQNPNVIFVFGDDIKPMKEWLNKHHPKWRQEYQELF